MSIIWNEHEKYLYIIMSTNTWNSPVFGPVILVTACDIVISMSSQPKKLKCSMCSLDNTQSTFFSLRNFLKKLSDDQTSSVTKGSIYYIKRMYIQPFSMEVDWLEMLYFMKHLPCFIFAHTVFLLCGANLLSIESFYCL